jgi:hypothetical protein
MICGGRCDIFENRRRVVRNGANVMPSTTPSGPPYFGIHWCNAYRPTTGKHRQHIDHGREGIFLALPTGLEAES